MTDYMVYYRRNPTFRADKKLKYRDVTEQRTHVLVSIESGYIDNPHKDEKDSVFYHMQGDFMRDHTRILCKNLIISGEMGHTSMSVGDVLRDADTGKMWQCDDVGWIPVRKITETRITRVAPVRYHTDESVRRAGIGLGDADLNLWINTRKLNPKPTLPIYLDDLTAHDEDCDCDECRQERSEYAYEGRRESYD